MSNEKDLQAQEALRKAMAEKFPASQKAVPEEATTPVVTPEQIKAKAVLQPVIEPQQEQEEVDVEDSSDSGISPVFDQLLQQSQQPEIQDEVNSYDPSNVLANIKIDLNNIEINDMGSDIDVLSNQDAILGNKKTMQIVCVQSAYSAEISALKNQEIQNVSESNVDYYNYKKKLYRAIWTHIENTSVGKMDFATWMKVTSYFDLETLLYGAYCQTFPYENKYNLQCPKPDCQSPFEVTVNNATLIETRGRDQEIFSKINEVVSNIQHSKDLIANSHVHTTKRVAVDEAKIAFDIQIPSVFDYLEGILGNVSEEVAQNYSTTLGLTLFIKKMYIPDVVNFQKTGKLVFIPVEDKEKIIELVAQLPYYDGIQLADAINTFTDRLRIFYSIKNAPCPQCGNVIKDVEMNMEDVLFTVIRQGRRDKAEPTVTTNI